MTLYSFSGQPKFSLLYHAEVLLNARFSLIGGQKHDKVKGGDYVLYQEGLKDEKTGLAAAVERIMKESTRFHLSAS